MSFRSILALTAILALIPVVESAICQNGVETNSIYEYTTGRCFYIKPMGLATETDRDAAETKCNGLDENSHNWHLPKMDADEKNRRLLASLQKATTFGDWMFWIGLKRDLDDDPSRWKDQLQWADPTKWRWVSDKTTLGGISFWKKIEPNNSPYIDREQIDANLERCVIAEMSSNDSTKAGWADWNCKLTAAAFKYSQMWAHLMLVCESTPATATVPTTIKSTVTIPPTTTPGVTTTPSIILTTKSSTISILSTQRLGTDQLTLDSGQQTASKDPKKRRDPNLWICFAIGAILTVVIVCIIALGAFCYLKRRMPKKSQFVWPRGGQSAATGTTTTGNSGTSYTTTANDRTLRNFQSTASTALSNVQPPKQTTLSKKGKMKPKSIGLPKLKSMASGKLVSLSMPKNLVANAKISIPNVKISKPAVKK